MSKLLRTMEEKGFSILLKIIFDVFLIIAGLFFINRFIKIEDKLNILDNQVNFNQLIVNK